MKDHQKYIYLIFWVLFTTVVIGQHEEGSIQMRAIQKEYEVGNTVTLQFSTSENVKPLLYCSNSYGSTLVTPIVDHNELHYQIPDFISNKSGVVYWKLIGHETVFGSFMMQPQMSVATIETYIGPPTIEAGDIDYTMLVVIPTDSLDNPLLDDTPVTVKHRFFDTQNEEIVTTANNIGYRNIYSRKESGRLLISSECLEVNSHEYTVDVLPAIPVDFTISIKRPHTYADGNQITSFYTSVIRDKHENIVADGTYVTFFIRNEEGNILKTSGRTVQGIATAKMIHPDQKAQWTVKAYVEGMAESNRITVDYEQVVYDVDIAFAKANREIKVGPLKSFMDQMIPDGFQVSLDIYKDDKLLKTYIKKSRGGYVSFYIKRDFFQNDIYTIKVKTAGLEKTFQNMKLW